MTSKYLTKFNNDKQNLLTLIGDEILVERIEVEAPRTKAGLYIPETTSYQKGLDVTNKPKFAVVLRVGSGFIDPETKEATPLFIKPGNVVLVSALSTEWFATLPFTGYAPETIGRTTESAVKWIFQSVEDYRDYFKGLESGET